METVAIVIPTLNEARAISKVINQVPVNELLNAGLEPTTYVVDGRSTDNTIDIARKMGARIVIEESRGKGAAIRTAFQRIEADYVIMVDGDDTYPIEVVPRMVQLLQTHDVVVGSRLKGRIEPGAMTQVNIVGNTLLTLLAQLLFNVKISDVCTGLRGFRHEAIRRLDLAARGFELEADLFAESVLNGCSIAEIPITYRARHDRPKLVSLRDGLKIGAFLFNKCLHQTKGQAVAFRAKNAEGSHK